jgi:DNA mismatch repair ATPase MutS
MFRYLKNCLKFDYIMSAVRFSFYEKEGSSMCMVMDSQALQHLEIFETPLGEKDSLFSKLDRTSTKFGKRLLRRWLMQPLMDSHKINQRLDAVEDLEAVAVDRNRVADIFSRLPDLEKIVNRLYHYSVKTIAEKAVYFEDVSSARLR